MGGGHTLAWVLLKHLAEDFLFLNDDVFINTLILLLCVELVLGRSVLSIVLKWLPPLLVRGSTALSSHFLITQVTQVNLKKSSSYKK